MPATDIESTRITPRSVKLIRRAEVVNWNKTHSWLEETAIHGIRAHEKVWHAVIAPQVVMPNAVYVSGVEVSGENVSVATEQPLTFPQLRLIARQRALRFVQEAANAYDHGLGAKALPKAIGTILDLVSKQEYVVIDSIFEQLSQRVIDIASKGPQSDEFPREGSLWIACLTLTKGAREKLDLRKAFINLLRAYANSFLQPTVAERLLRNVD